MKRYFIISIIGKCLAIRLQQTSEKRYRFSLFEKILGNGISPIVSSGMKIYNANHKEQAAKMLTV